MHVNRDKRYVGRMKDKRGIQVTIRWSASTNMLGQVSDRERERGEEKHWICVILHDKVILEQRFKI